MTYKEIAGWMVKSMGAEAEAVAAEAERAYRSWRESNDEPVDPARLEEFALIARRTALEVSIIAHGGLPAIEGSRHAV